MGIPVEITMGIPVENSPSGPSRHSPSGTTRHVPSGTTRHVPSGVILGRPWGPFGLPWAPWATLLGVHGIPLGHLGLPWALPWGGFGPLWVILGRPWGPFELPWASLGPPLQHWVTIFRHFGSHLPRLRIESSLPEFSRRYPRLPPATRGNGVRNCCSDPTSTRAGGQDDVS